MDKFEQMEQRQLEKLEELRRTFQTVLRANLWLLVILFFAFLVGFLTYFYFKAQRSDSRYEATVIMHYQPRQSKTVSSFSDKYVLSILRRRNVKSKLTSEESNKSPLAAENGQEDGLFLPEENEEGEGAGSQQSQSLPSNVRIETAYRQSDCFYLSVSAPTAEAAKNFANNLAEYCKDAYVAARVERLELIRENTKKQLEGFQEKMASLSKDMDSLKSTAVRINPERNYEMLQAGLTGAEAELARLESADLGLRDRQKLLTDKIKNNKLDASDISRIHEMNQDLVTLEQELKRLKDSYTDSNPKVVAQMRRLSKAQEEFSAFLANKGVKLEDLANQDDVTANIKELDQITTELKLMESRLEIQRGLVKSKKEEIDLFNREYPRRQEIVREQGKLGEAIAHQEETMNDLSVIQDFAANELFVGEEASVRENLAFTKETLSISMLGTVMLTGLVALLLLLSGYRFGVVSGEEELQNMSGLEYLGVLPTKKSRFSGDTSEEQFFSRISLHFNCLSPQPQAVFLGALPGGEMRQEFVDAFMTDFKAHYHSEGLDASEKKRPILVLQLVSKGSAPMVVGSDAEGCGKFISYWKERGQGYISVATPSKLTEEEKKDLRIYIPTLTKKFGLVCVVQSNTLSTKGVALEEALEQAASYCDAAILALGVRKTTRHLARRLQAVAGKVKMRIMTVLSGCVKG